MHSKLHVSAPAGQLLQVWLYLKHVTVLAALVTSYRCAESDKNFGYWFSNKKAQLTQGLRATAVRV